MSSINLIGEKKSGRLFNQTFSNSLVLTYNIDLIFYENTILKEFLNLGSANNILLADRSQLAISMQNQYKYLQKDSSSYAFLGVNTGKLFHSKAILLTGEREVRLFLGSGNMTFSGLSNNREVYAEFCSSNNSHQEILWSFKRYIDQLLTIEDTEGFLTKRIEEVFSVPSFNAELTMPQSGTERFLHNLTTPILEQILPLVKNTKKIHILSPFYDKDFETAKYLKNTIQQNTNLYIQEDYTNVDSSMLQNELQAFSLGDLTRNTHAKIIIFEEEDSLSILFGSANCTRPALLETIKRGNTEIAVFVQSISKDLLEYYLPKELIPLNPDELRPIQMSSLVDMPEFIIYSATNTKKGYLELKIIRIIEDNTTLEVIINDEIIRDPRYEIIADEKLLRISVALPNNRLNYVSIILNNENSNTVLILDEQKNILKISGSETRALNNMKEYLPINSVDDIAFLRSLSPFYEVSSIATRKYITDKNIGLDSENATALEEEKEKVKDSRDYYVSYTEQSFFSGGKSTQAVNAQSFIMELFNIAPKYMQSKVLASDPQSKRLPVISDDDNKIDLSIYEFYKPYLAKVVERIDTTARIYGFNKLKSLSDNEFNEFFYEFMEVIPLTNLLLSGLSLTNDLQDTFAISFSPSQQRQLMLPMLKVFNSFWEHSLLHKSFLEEMLTKSFICKWLLISMINVAVLERIFLMSQNDGNIKLNLMSFRLAFYQTITSIIEIISVFEISEDNLLSQNEIFTRGFYLHLLERFKGSIEIENSILFYLSQSRKLTEFKNKEQMIKFVQMKSNESFFDQLNTI